MVNNQRIDDIFEVRKLCIIHEIPSQRDDRESGIEKHWERAREKTCQYVKKATNRAIIGALLVTSGVLLCGVTIRLLPNRFISPDQVVAFKEVQGVVLEADLFLPGIEDRKKVGIICFFGGGWQSGNRRQLRRLAKDLKEDGYVVACVDYRTGNEYGVEPKDCVADGKSAVRWFRSQADRYGFKRNQIIAVGISAGAHVAAATAMLPNFEHHDDDFTVSCRPNRLILISPVLDTGPGGFGYNRVRDYAEAFSLEAHFSNEMPQTLILLGNNDEITSVKVAERFQQGMKDQGVSCQLGVLNGANHSFFLNKINKSGYEWAMVEIKSFLEKAR